MFGLGSQELLIISGVVVLLFGGSKLPQLGSALGKGLRNFKQGVKDLDADPSADEAKEKTDEPE